MTYLRVISIGLSSLLGSVAASILLAHAIPDDQALRINLSGVPAPYSFGHVCKLSSGDLWIVGGGGSVQRISHKADVQKMIVTDVDLNGVFFVSANTGWIAGEHGRIFHTEDGGMNWKDQLSGVDNELHAITCWDENRCWSVGEAGIVLITEDGGSHWRFTKSGVSVQLLAVDFVSSRIGWAAGEDGVVLHTTDGGNSWESQRAQIILFRNGPFAKPADLMAVKFIDENRGWVAGAGGIAMTTDRGKSWTAKQIEGAAFIGLVSRDGKAAWAINRAGPNYFTTNGGHAWKPIKPEKPSVRRNAGL